jgi:hypothetical protein
MYARKMFGVFLLAGIACGQTGPKQRPVDEAHYPRLVHAELPLYPALASTMRILDSPRY